MSDTFRVWFPAMAPRRQDGTPAVLCLAGAGGGPSEFHDWQSLLGEDVEVAAVALPGRERRITEPPGLPLNTLVAQVIDAAGPLLERPFALYGHSLGALLMYEVARALPDPSKGNLRHLFAGGQAAPSRPQFDALRSERSDDELVDYLRQLGGTPEEILGSPAFMRPYLRCLRADLAIGERYAYPGPAALDCPVTLFQGAQDTGVPAEWSAAWARETTGAFRVVTLAGGHFSLRSDRQVIVEEIARGLRRSGVRAARP